MKKAILTLLSLALTQAMPVFASAPDSSPKQKTWAILSQNLKVVNVCNITDTEMNEVMQGHLPEVAVEFSTQTTLPIRFFLRGNLVNLVEEEKALGFLEIKQTFYVRYLEEEIFVSTNLIDWKPFFKFITGNLSMALSVTDGQPSFIFGAEVNRRP